MPAVISSLKSCSYWPIYFFISPLCITRVCKLTVIISRPLWRLIDIEVERMKTIILSRHDLFLLALSLNRQCLVINNIVSHLFWRDSPPTMNQSYSSFDWLRLLISQCSTSSPKHQSAMATLENTSKSYFQMKLPRIYNMKPLNSIIASLINIRGLCWPVMPWRRLLPWKFEFWDILLSLERYDLEITFIFLTE